MRKVITIDGPSGVGKGTLAKFLAKHLGWALLDSGALYRVVANHAKKLGLDVQNEHDRMVLAPKIADFNIDFSSTDLHPKWGVRVFLHDEDVTEDIRSEQCGVDASFVAKDPLIREALFGLQQSFGLSQNLVADGRDMGSVVFPNAALKLFLTASDKIRAQRRCKQLSSSNNGVRMPEILSALKSRDDRDKNRSVSPLKPAEDAITIDTSGLDVDQVRHRVLELLKKTNLS